MIVSQRYIVNLSLVMVVGLGLCLLSAPVEAMPPHDDLRTKVAAHPEMAPYFMSNLADMRAKGIGQPSATSPLVNQSYYRKIGSSEAATEFRALALLVGFSNQAQQVAASFFDSLIFGTDGATVRDYYNEVSYGQLDIVSIDSPSSLGWLTAPEPYTYYVNGQNGTGGYPNNSQKLVEDLIDEVDPLVDFSQYDNDGDGYVDILMVIHSGSGAEFSGSNDDIWSHEWAISPRVKDGVAISTFTMQPEYWSTPGDMTIGVCCHELGHGLGLPDLYDIDYSSNGIGEWGVMAYGSWLGPFGMGSSPSHFSAWCKARMGFLEPINLTTNLSDQTIVNIEDNAVAYRLWNVGAASDEYFLVANRQRIGYDSYLPATGLLIWHIDEARSSNSQEWYPGLNTTLHPLVALEQSDGLYALEKRSDGGDMGDPYPGLYGEMAFNALSSPNSNSYNDGVSYVAVNDIHAVADDIQADLIVGFASGQGGGDDPPSVPSEIELAQNYPNPFNPTTTLGFTLEEGAQVTLEVFNALGRRVATAFKGQVPAGHTELVWTAVDDKGRELSSGVYFYRLSIGDNRQTRKMLLLR